MIVFTLMLKPYYIVFRLTKVKSLQLFYMGIYQHSMKVEHIYYSYIFIMLY